MVSSNNAINNTVGASISGVTNTLTVTNASNTASSAARTKITVGGASAADPTINFNVNGVTDWEMGIDNSDSDNWKLSQASSLGTNDTIIAYTSGAVTKPRLPSFRAYYSATASNVTGDGTNFSLVFDSTDWNIGSVYDAGTGIFTAPIDGYYFFNVRLRLTGLTSAHTNFTLSCNDPLLRGNAANLRNNGNAIGISASTMLFLNATDTVQCVITVSNGTKVVNVENISNDNNTFFGYLVH